MNLTIKPKFSNFIDQIDKNLECVCSLDSIPIDKTLLSKFDELKANSSTESKSVELKSEENFDNDSFLNFNFKFKSNFTKNDDLNSKSSSSSITINKINVPLEFDNVFSSEKKTKDNIFQFDSQVDEENKLEKIYNRILNKHSKKTSNKKVSNKKYNNDNKPLTKTLAKLIYKNIFIESTRGFNITENVFILNMDKLKLNLQKFNLYPNIKIGYLYRNYLDPKAHTNLNINTYWIETTLYNNVLSVQELKSNDSFLLACLKNFTTETKFKKQIGKTKIRASKYSVQVSSANIVIDIIFFIKL